MKKDFIVENEYKGKRLDIFLSDKLELTRSQIKNYIDNILVNNKVKKLSYLLKENDLIIVDIHSPEINDNSPTPENIDIDIIYEDDCLAIINKCSGMSVHCSPSEISGTLVNALLYHIKDFDFYGDTMRAGIIHRLDKDTSGLIIIGKSPSIVTNIQDQFKARSVKKTYHAITIGRTREDEININLPIGRHQTHRKKMTVNENGKESITIVQTLKRFSKHSLVEAMPKTGRTHQIRVHLSHKSYPIAGDKIYSKSSSKYTTLMLHAKELSFRHPKTNEIVTFQADYPKHFYELLYSENI